MSEILIHGASVIIIRRPRETSLYICRDEYDPHRYDYDDVTPASMRRLRAVLAWDGWEFLETNTPDGMTAQRPYYQIWQWETELERANRHQPGGAS